MGRHATWISAAQAISLGVVFASDALAQDTVPVTVTPFLSVELNTADQAAGSCRLTFVAQNSLGADLAAAVLETVLFDTSGQVIDLTLFDFKDLPDGSPRVRQFDLAGVQCASLGRVLLNGVHACTGLNLTADICAAGLRWTSRIEIEVVG